MPYRSITETRQQLEKAPDNVYHVVAIETETQRLVGDGVVAQLKHSRQHVGQIGLAVHDDYQGLGIGKRLLQEIIDIADNWLAIKRLELTVFAENQPAVHLYQQYGFLVEGTLKSYAYRDGDYRDAYTMARIAD